MGLHKVANFCRLGRIGMSPLTMSVPIMGALTLGQSLAPMEVISLGLLGLCAHLFGFALNDIVDRQLDRTVPSRQEHPLVTGELALWQVWLFALVRIPLALGIYHFFLAGTWPGASFLYSSIGLSLVYNLWSKHGYVPKFFAELGLATSVGLLCLTGAFSQMAHLTPRSILFALVLTLVLLLLNSIPSGLKDLKTDYEFGLRSFVIAMGYRMVDEDRMVISKSVQIYSFSLHQLILLCLLGLTYLCQPLLWHISLLVGLLWLYAGLHLRMVLTITSFQLLRQFRPILSGVYNYLGLILFLLGWMPLYLQVGYGVLILASLIMPWVRSFRMWHYRYQLLLN